PLLVWRITGVQLSPAASQLPPTAQPAAGEGNDIPKRLVSVGSDGTAPGPQVCPPLSLQIGDGTHGPVPTPRAKHVWPAAMPLRLPASATSRTLVRSRGICSICQVAPASMVLKMFAGAGKNDAPPKSQPVFSDVKRIPRTDAPLGRVPSLHVAPPSRVDRSLPPIAQPCVELMKSTSVRPPRPLPGTACECQLAPPLVVAMTASLHVPVLKQSTPPPIPTAHPFVPLTKVTPCSVTTPAGRACNVHDWPPLVVATIAPGQG